MIARLRPIQYRILEHRRHVKVMRSRSEESRTAHKSNLSPAKESVIQLSLLLCQIDSFLEVGILDDLFQGGRKSSQQASRSFGIESQKTVRDVWRSSTEVNPLDLSDPTH